MKWRPPPPRMARRLPLALTRPTALSLSSLTACARRGSRVRRPADRILEIRDKRVLEKQKQQAAAAAAGGSFAAAGAS